jgi:copper chaperone CopZ
LIIKKALEGLEGVEKASISFKKKREAKVIEQ